MLKKNGRFVEKAWAEALELEDILEKLKAVEK
jgi:hypothetical protein